MFLFYCLRNCYMISMTTKTITKKIMLKLSCQIIDKAGKGLAKTALCF